MIVTMALFVAVSTCAFAQVESGQFVRRITDAQGAVVQNAAIKVNNVTTNIVQEAQTNSIGDYVITPIAAGEYRLSVNTAGFASVTTTTIEV
jgi:hypothetical protein